MFPPRSPALVQSQRQSQKQVQRMMMLPHMQQALAFLQLPVLELAAAIDTEMKQNPLLDSDIDLDPPSEVEVSETEEADDPGTATSSEELTFADTDFSVLRLLDEEFRDHFSQDDMTYRPRTAEDAKRQSFLEGNILREETLSEFLLQQATETFSDPKDRQIAELLIGYLDENGYLTTPLAEIAQLHDYPLADIQRILTEIQTFEPVGVGSTCLQQSLLTQIRHAGHQNSLAYRVIENCWDDLLHHRIPTIAKRLSVSSTAVSKAINDEIAFLDFHPGNSFGARSAHPIVPDVTIRLENDKLVVIVNDDPLPSFRFNQRYLRLLDDPTTSEETKDFVRQKLTSAKWLRKSVDQRNDTLTRIANCLIEHQDQYLRDPKGQLRPLTMKSIAEELAVHESTVARAVADKYVDCPRGIVPMRSFFTQGLVAIDGTDVSSRTICDALEELISRENKARPLSDQALVKLLKAQGLLCARRTVAKYRNELAIGNALQRRVFG